MTGIVLSYINDLFADLPILNDTLNNEKLQKSFDEIEDNFEKLSVEAKSQYYTIIEDDVITEEEMAGATDELKKFLSDNSDKMISNLQTVASEIKKGPNFKKVSGKLTEDLEALSDALNEIFGSETADAEK